MLDIDFFKKVNDNYGHPMGDQVIKEVSHFMQAKISQVGVVGRFGGEEFLSIIYDENNNKVFNLADEIRRGIENKSTILDGVEVNVTVSMGIASSFESKVFQELIDIADKRLYKAKKNGRNQVVFS
jgi:diguanylate cyclase (GGDEF)-like protein